MAVSSNTRSHDVRTVMENPEATQQAATSPTTDTAAMSPAADTTTTPPATTDTILQSTTHTTTDLPAAVAGIDTAELAALVTAVSQASRDQSRELARVFQQQMERWQDRESSTGAGFTKPKPQQRVFDGNPEKLRIWLFSIEEDFKATRRTSDDDRLAYAVSLLDGPAIYWFYGLDKMGQRPRTWAQFRGAILHQFRSDDEQVRLREVLSCVKQTTSVRKYIADFMEVYLSTENMDQHSVLLYFFKGLHAKISTEVRLRAPTTLAEAMRVAQTVDDAMPFEREKLRPWATATTAAASTAPRAAAAASKGESTTTAAELHAAGGAFKFPPKLTAAERERLLRTGSCFKCRQQGHMSADCPVAWPVKKADFPDRR